ncbi:unnamed protein product [Blepharisma stoltei]|uniref:Uncharacterized protein n=1 Tax=Blepharisma stoltei TaxID=1481888 RepID=A0AAU9J0T3_9CILI|nr:unnamed protein product [Blepharisma stoltei]
MGCCHSQLEPIRPSLPSFPGSLTSTFSRQRFSSISQSNSPQLFSNNFLYLFDCKDNKTRLTLYDTVLRDMGQRFIQTPEPLDKYTSTAQLPNSEIFCFGNHDPSSGFACIIDMKQLKVKKTLPPGAPCNSVAAVYYKNSVYIFGGFDGSKSTTLANRFDLSLNKWNKLAPLPMESFNCSCIEFNECILVSGYYHTKVYKYDLTQNNYSELSEAVVDGDNHKILAVANSRAYIVENYGFILESDEMNEMVWRKIGKSTLTSFAQHYWIWNDGSLFIGLIHWYASDYFYDFYQFELREKKFERIGEYEIKV